MAKIGILGGSFNPIHAGHMRMAVEARETVGLERVLLMPAGEPPHKPAQGMLPFAHRLRLVELAVRGVTGLSASGFEGTRSGPSYSVDTLLALREKMPGDELHFIMGSESFLALPKWNRGLELPHLCSIAVVLRPGADSASIAAFAETTWPGMERAGHGRMRFASGTSLFTVDMPVLEVSSTDIRRRWCERRCLAMLVPSAAEEILERGGSAYEQAWGQRVES
ncbi:MAG: nicotinate (nicotinamide) nucleotide adenylyltransferase [Desulfovibrionales bacterium GWA2_65_9]|nr:MAG: nicotinate (nicotinamide) nucleotide adenylyltransferase [Desulfovibrionales bacterium GWA2_65_9]